MSLHGPYLSKPSLVSIHLLHIERQNTWAVQWGFTFRFLENRKIAKTKKICDKSHKDFYVYKFVLPQSLTVFYNRVMW